MAPVPIRVLIVEDSPTVCDLLCSALKSDPGFDLIGIARTGAEAIALCKTEHPDVISMDMILPGLSGLDATRHIMAWCPTPILVVSSSFNRGELFQMYDALAAGAVDVLEKPDGVEPQLGWDQRYRAALKLVSRIRVITHLSGRAEGVATQPEPVGKRSSRTSAPRHVIALGASTGGPGAVIEVLRALPPDLGVPILFVLHLNAQFSGAFAEWLGAQSAWPAAFANDGDPLPTYAGRIAVAPPGRHMRIDDGRIRLSSDPERHSCRPSIDVLFESVADECGPAACAALLTGMGKDGAAGLRAMRDAGALTIAQDEQSSVVFGMPREAVRLGGASRVLPLGEIGAALRRHAEDRRPVLETLP